MLFPLSQCPHSNPISQSTLVRFGNERSQIKNGINARSRKNLRVDVQLCHTAAVARLNHEAHRASCPPLQTPCEAHPLNLVVADAPLTTEKTTKKHLCRRQHDPEAEKPCESEPRYYDRDEQSRGVNAMHCAAPDNQPRQA